MADGSYRLISGLPELRSKRTKAENAANLRPTSKITAEIRLMHVNNRNNTTIADIKYAISASN